MSSNLEVPVDGGIPAELRPYQQLMKELEAVAQFDEDAAFDIAARVIDEIQMATTFEDVFAANEKGPTGAEEILNETIGVYSIRPWKSAEKFAKGTLGYYMVVDFVNASGEADMFSVGASNVVASLWRLFKLSPNPDGFGITGNKDMPLWCKVTGRETVNGTLYLLVGAEPPPF